MTLAVELQERFTQLKEQGKDSPRQRQALEFSHLGETAGLFLRLSKAVFGTGKVAALGSGFRALQTIAELAKKGALASSLIKKRKHWPKRADGEMIKRRAQIKNAGRVEQLPGSEDGTPFEVFYSRNPDCTMMLASARSSLITKPDRKTSTRLADGKSACFECFKAVGNHYQHRDTVDNHN